MAKAKVNLKKDISNRAVLIMLLTIIVVSIISLGIYMNALEKVAPEKEAATNNAPEVTLPEAKTISTNSAQGVASIEIINPK